MFDHLVRRFLSNAVFFQFRCKRNVRVLAFKIVEEKRYMVQGSEKKKTVIDVTLVQKRFAKKRAVVKR